MQRPLLDGPPSRSQTRRRVPESVRSSSIREREAVVVDTASVAIQRCQFLFSFVKMGTTEPDHNAEVCMHSGQFAHACMRACLRVLCWMRVLGAGGGGGGNGARPIICMQLKFRMRLWESKEAALVTFVVHAVRGDMCKHRFDLKSAHVAACVRACVSVHACVCACACPCVGGYIR